MNQKIKFFTTLFLVFTQLMFSQKKWSLDECISFALKNNLLLTDNQYNINSNKETHRQSIRSLLPNLNAYTDYNIRYGRSIDPNTNAVSTNDFFSNNYSLELSLDLFQGFKKINTIKANKLAYLASQKDSDQQKYLLGFRVMSAYYDILYFQEVLEISKQQVSVSETNYTAVDKKVSLGVSAKSDLYEAESLLLTDRLQVTKSENDLMGAKLKLIQEMNLEGVTSIDIHSSALELYSERKASEFQVDSIYGKAINFLPIIESNELKVKEAKAQVKVSRGNYYPILRFRSGIGSGYFETNTDSDGNTISFSEQFDTNTFKYIAFSLNVPIFNGWTQRSDVKQKKITLLQAENTLKTQKQEVLKTIQDLVLKQYSLAAEYSQSNLKVKSQRLAFITAQKKYERGIINAIELFTAKNLFATAENENLQIKLSLLLNEKTLDFYKGMPIFNIQ
nr:TolC family protein [Tenacibaculum mesophilum]